MTHRPWTPADAVLPGTAGLRQASSSGSPGDGDGAGVRAVAACRPSACGRVWLKYVIAAAVQRMASSAAPATTFHASLKATPRIRRRRARGSRQGTAGASPGAGKTTPSLNDPGPAGAAPEAVKPPPPPPAATARNTTPPPARPQRRLPTH